MWPCQGYGVISTNVGWCKLCWFAPAQLWAPCLQPYCWGAVLGLPQAYPIVTLNNVNIHIVNAPWSQLSHTVHNWEQVLYVIWRLCYWYILFCWEFGRQFHKFGTLEMGVLVGDRRHWMCVDQVILLSHLLFWYDRQGLLHWMHPELPDILDNIFYWGLCRGFIRVTRLQRWASQF
jgi:hypothetical protein